MTLASLQTPPDLMNERGLNIEYDPEQLKRIYNPEHIYKFFTDGMNGYALEPLQDLGPNSLICYDIPGIESVHLTEIIVLIADAHGTKEIKQGSDLFLSYGSNLPIPKGAYIASATLEITFATMEKPECVKIMPPASALFTGKNYLLIKQLLEVRGFIVPLETYRG